jgi:serine phosphatase RsbU (regulator of sigma subunit)
MFFNRPKQPSPEEIRQQEAAKRRQAAFQRVAKLMDSDPVFRSCTFDGLYWIDPFTGALISAPFDFRTVATQHLMQDLAWTKTEPKSILDMRTLQWQHYLQERVESDARFKFFSKEGAWINPFNGRLCNQVKKVEGKVTPAVLRAMCRILAHYETADPEHLLTYEQMLERFPSLDPEIAGSKAHYEAVVSAEDLNTMVDWSSLGGAEGKDSTFVAQVQAKPEIKVPTDKVETDVYFATEKPESLQSPSRTKTRLSSANPPAKCPSDSDSDRLSAKRSSTENIDTLLKIATERREKKHDFDKAGEVYQHMMGSPPKIAGIEFGLFARPMEKIGGDFHDFIRLSDTDFCFIVGDISGHGMQAALIVGTVLKSLRYLVRNASCLDLVEIATRLNDEARTDLVSGQFFTAFLGILHVGNPAKGIETRLDCVCAGHHPAVVINPKGPDLMRLVGKPGVAMGIGNEAMVRKQTQIVTEILHPGETLCVYTDGVEEAQDAKTEEFGHWRSRAAFLGHLEGSAQEQADQVAQDVLAWTQGNPQDDITILTVRVG